MKKLAAMVLLLGVMAHPAFSADDYHLLKKIPIPGTGSWDYLTVDESARRLYVSHGMQVEVLDVDSGAIVGQIPNTLNWVAASSATASPQRLRFSI